MKLEFDEYDECGNLKQHQEIKNVVCYSFYFYDEVSTDDYATLEVRLENGKEEQYYINIKDFYIYGQI